MATIDNYIAALESATKSCDKERIIDAEKSLKAFIDYVYFPNRSVCGHSMTTNDPASPSPSSVASENSLASEFPDDDKVNNPSHYQSYYKDGIDCLTAMEHACGKTAVAHFCLCNAFKYLWRHSSKGGMNDINKALWYLNKYKELNIIELGD